MNFGALPKNWPFPSTRSLLFSKLIQQTGPELNIDSHSGVFGAKEGRLGGQMAKL
jgi:hypothetical protein